MAMIDLQSLLIGIAVGIFSVVCIRIVDYIFEKFTRKNK